MIEQYQARDHTAEVTQIVQDLKQVKNALQESTKEAALLKQ